MKQKKIAVALAAGLTLGTMFAAPVTASVAEAASESVMKLKSPAETYAAQGKKLFDEGKFEEAGEAFRNAAKEDEKNDEYWFRAGKAFYKAEKFISAADCIKKAVKLKPDNGNYNKWLGVAYWKQIFQSRNVSKDTLIERATKYTGRAAELMPNDIDAQLTAGIIQEKAANYYQGLSRSGWFMAFPGAIEKDFRKAYQYYRRAVEIDPNNAKNVATLNRFINENSNYGFQPYKPATPPAPRGNTDAPNVATPNPSADSEMYTYTPVHYYNSKGAIPAFCPLGRRYEYGKETSSWATIYRNPYKEGGEYIIICGWVEPKGTMNAEGPYLFEYQDTFDYDPDEGWFTFTGSENTMGDLNRYYMRARVGEAPNTIEVEWITGERGSGGIPNAPTLRTDIPYPREVYTQRFVAQSEVEIGNNFWIQDVTAEPYRFVSEYKIRTNQNGYVTGVIDNLNTAPISAMFAFLDFLNEGNTPDAIDEPPSGMNLPHRNLLKHPELYNNPNIEMYYPK